mmetsp:Transcript_34988/g.85746  ORF Transcript_34988/g.85746 Transcript_34988/m.85746 type:complete len:442 (-) Transcript_34988:347-1672(-)
MMNSVLPRLMPTRKLTVCRPFLLLLFCLFAPRSCCCRRLSPTTASPAQPSVAASASSSACRSPPHAALPPCLAPADVVQDDLRGGRQHAQVLEHPELEQHVHAHGHDGHEQRDGLLLLLHAVVPAHLLEHGLPAVRAVVPHQHVARQQQDERLLRRLDAEEVVLAVLEHAADGRAVARRQHQQRGEEHGVHVAVAVHVQLVQAHLLLRVLRVLLDPLLDVAHRRRAPHHRLVVLLGFEPLRLLHDLRADLLRQNQLHRLGRKRGHDVRADDEKLGAAAHQGGDDDEAEEVLRRPCLHEVSDGFRHGGLLAVGVPVIVSVPLLALEPALGYQRRLFHQLRLLLVLRRPARIPQVVLRRLRHDGPEYVGVEPLSLGSGGGGGGGGLLGAKLRLARLVGEVGHAGHPAHAHAQQLHAHRPVGVAPLAAAAVVPVLVVAVARVAP